MEAPIRVSVIHIVTSSPSRPSHRILCDARLVLHQLAFAQEELVQDASQQSG